jgi:multisubunit Na+/H+ antiporter MnhF subunit
MIDTWLFATVCLFILSFCAVLRIIPGPTRFDRLIALNTAITIACAGLLCLTIALGNLLVLYSAIILVIACFTGTIYSAHQNRGETR